MKQKTTYAVIRIDFEHDGRFSEEEIKGLAADIVVGRARAHCHTVENGIAILNIGNCGESA